MRFGLIYLLVLIWTIVSAILCLNGVGQFTEWELTAWPWHWSCFCILYWYMILWVVLFGGISLWVIYEKWRQKKMSA